MKTWTVHAEVTISTVAHVKANTYAEAIEAAQRLPMPDLCHQCARHGEDVEDECWNVSELDGEPCNTRAECDE